MSAFSILIHYYFSKNNLKYTGRFATNLKIIQIRWYIEPRTFSAPQDSACELLRYHYRKCCFQAYLQAIFVEKLPYTALNIYFKTLIDILGYFPLDIEP